MTDFQKGMSAGAESRLAGLDRIIGSISWLLIALVSLDIKLAPTDRRSTLLVSGLCLALFSYNVTARRLPLFRKNRQAKASVDLTLLFFFVVAVCWFTGKVTSPFISVLYLLLMATSLTLGKRVTYLMAALAVTSYALLAAAQSQVMDGQLIGRLVELFPFMLIAHLGARLSGETESARLQVEKLSLTDDLTELNNMRSFEALAQQQERLARRHQKSFAICMLDSDNLKQINDRYGHLAGTELIKWTARVIRENTRSSDIAARFGGDEFIILYDDHDKHQIRPAVERIVRAMAANPFQFDGETIDSTLSAGIASYPGDGADLREVIMRADEAMYQSKRLGKNRVSLFLKQDRESGEEGYR